MTRGVKGSGPYSKYAPKEEAVIEAAPEVVNDAPTVSTVDLTPSWTFVAHVYAMNLLDGTDYEVRRSSADEVVKMGRTLDRLLAFIESQGLTEAARAFVRGQ